MDTSQNLLEEETLVIIILILITILLLHLSLIMTFLLLLLIPYPLLFTSLYLFEQCPVDVHHGPFWLLNPALSGIQSGPLHREGQFPGMVEPYE